MITRLGGIPVCFCFIFMLLVYSHSGMCTSSNEFKVKYRVVCGVNRAVLRGTAGWLCRKHSFVNRTGVIVDRCLSRG